MENFFELMDVDEDGVWGFGEFLSACAKFLCGTQEMLIELCFRIFDNDKDGYLDEEELDQFVAMVHGPGTIYHLDLDAVLALYDSKNDGVIDFLEFEQAAKNYPMILWKIHDLKSSFTSKICGREFWTELFIRIHPDHLDDFYEKWIAGLKAKWKSFKMIAGTILETCQRLFACFCPCFCSGPDDAQISPQDRTQVQDVFPDAQALEQRLNLEVDEDFESSDGEEYEKYIISKGKTEA